MLPSETMIWQPEFTDKILSRKPGAVHTSRSRRPLSLQSPFLVGALKKNTALSPTCWSLTP
ncbi:hypothetical protein EPS71_23335, partial [Escherichia coli]